MHSAKLSIWFFIGVLFTIYGALIGAYGVYVLVTHRTPHVVLASLNAPVWWGSLMLVIGLFYILKFRPGHDE